ncbi:MAG: hypothetical protein KKB95_10325 [Gammaproteobacteria bacterium]|nr:hypothetical protein [Gammaproteobacteria bacterium]MBU1508145.1 hypothetical protein [Gammaproteobacteria bacterium]MBU2120708.1 hypothetical protein [Gammaproteobacteria bacterium]MBU2169455.1 hypothetical protein [Gammaproteobacteria bacterium]MBU2200465.1 hypothetical protein [Gammaproteobacteria bacterium]
MTLNYLDFDYSEDADGTGTFDAMASVSPAQLPALHAEIAQVLAWAYRHFPDGCGPEEDGGLWQYDLQGVQEVSTLLQLDFDATSSSIQCGLGNASAPRTTLTLSVSGNADFCEALRDAFDVE